MSPRNAERIALVTGANRGIGLETVRELARRWFDVIAAARDEAKGRRAVGSTRAEAGKFLRNRREIPG